MQKTPEPACRGSRHLVYAGHQLCNKGFAKLMGIGKGRFEKMRRALSQGAEYCPYDSRYIPKGPTTNHSEAWFKVHEHLTQLYLECAETIPDGLNSNKRPRQANNRYDREDMNRGNIKHLPHASINDYYIQCKAALPGVKVSKKLFTSVAEH